MNHPQSEMLRNEGFNAITQVSQEDGGVRFNPSSGIPVLLFFCSDCGYVEMYAVAKAAQWK